VVILTALELEYRAVMQVSAGAEEGTQWVEAKSALGLPVAFRVFKTRSRGTLRVAVTRVDSSASSSATASPSHDAAALQALLAMYRPACIALAGLCEGRPGKTHLGDVIAADRLVARGGSAAPLNLNAWNLRDDWKLGLERFDFVSRLRNATWWSQRPIAFEWQENWLLWKLFIGVEDPGKHPECETFCPQYGKVLKSLWNSGHVVRPELTLTEQGRSRLMAALKPLRNRFPNLLPTGPDLPFSFHVAPIALGGEAISDETGWQGVDEQGRKTLGLERGSAAMGALSQAWHTRSERRFDLLVVKGVADLEPLGRNEPLKNHAARASAECILAFLREDFSVDVLPGVEDLLLSGTDAVPEQPPPSALLAPRHEGVPFLEKGCAEALLDLETWCDASTAVSVRLLTAPAGVGKTRLAIHWLRRRSGMGWAAGFLPRTLPDTWFERLWHCRRPVLVVIDDADRFPNLGKVLKQAHGRHSGPGDGWLHRMRILLLSRDRGAWWEALRQEDEEMRVWLDAAPSQEFQPRLSDESSRNGAFYAAADAYARYLRLPPAEEPPELLANPRLDRMLDLHMAALATVENVPFEKDTGREALTDQILDLEERFWGQHVVGNAPGGPATFRADWVRQIMAAATLRGGLRRFDDATALAARLTGAQPSPEDKDALRRLSRIYAPTRGGPFLPPLEPELLGERLVLRLASQVQGDGGIGSDWIHRVFLPGDDARAKASGREVLLRASGWGSTTLAAWLERLQTLA